MPWTMNDYPDSMKNMDKVIRKKAIDIANAMIDEGYDEGRAIPIAIDQAREWHDNASKEELEEYKKEGDPTERSDDDDDSSGSPERMDETEEVIPREDGWAVKSSGSDRASEVFDKKEDAVDRGKEIAENKQTALVIRDKDGKEEDRINYEEE